MIQLMLSENVQYRCVLEKGQPQRCNNNLNTPHIKLAICKYSSLVIVPSCELTFMQHVLICFPN